MKSQFVIKRHVFLLAEKADLKASITPALVFKNINDTSSQAFSSHYFTRYYIFYLSTFAFDAQTDEQSPKSNDLPRLSLNSNNIDMLLM
jgi:hypothetical protein